MNMTSKGKIGLGAANNEDVCPICYELYKSTAEKTFLRCAHYFHKDCIDQWLTKDDSCPICRSFAKEEMSPSAPSVYPDAHVVNVAAEAYATFGAMQQPRQMENCTHNSNFTGRRSCIRCFNSTNCYNCINCNNSDYCQNCSNSHNCDDCQSCSSCHNCDDCLNCTSCNNCDDCESCIKCRNCDDCYNCTNCYNCIRCTNCTNCRNLVRCHNITNGGHIFR